MAKAVDKMILQIVMDNKKAIKGMQKFQDKSKTMAKKSGGFLKGLKASWLGVVAAIGGGVLAIRNIMKLTISHEKAVAKLNNTLINNGTATKEQVKELLKYNDTLQDSTGFSNDEITAAQAMLGTFKLTAEQIKKLTPRLLDMNAAVESSSGTQQDLTQTALQLGKVFTGYESSLSRVGVTVTDTEKKNLKLATGMEKVNIVTKILDNNFKGTAETVGKTFGGQLKILQGTFDDLQKMIGKEFVKQLHPMILKMNEFLQSEKGLRQIKSAVKGIVGGFLVLKGAIVTVVNVFSPFIKAISNINEMMFVFNEQIKAKNYSAAFKVLSVGSKRTGKAFTESFKNIKTEWTNTAEHMKNMYKEVEEETVKTTGNLKNITVDNQTEQIETMKANVTDYYSYVGAQREIDKIKEDESYLKSIESLNMLLENEKMTKEEHDVALEEMKLMHDERMLEYEIQQKERMMALESAAMMTYNKDYTDLTIKQKIELNNQYKNQQKLWGDIKKVTGEAIGTVVNTYADGFAEMVVSGKSFKKSFVDFFNDIIKLAAKLIIKLLVIKALKMAFGGVGLFFSGGGKVPKKPVYAANGMKPRGTDTVPAMLTPNERVLSVRQNEAFEGFINAFSRIIKVPKAGQYMQTGGVVGDTINDSSVVIQNMTVQAENGQDFVDQMEELSIRTNSRMMTR